MRIRGWHIDGFGIFRDAAVTDLPPGLTIVSGPNEAGKSTLLAFLRGVLFGFPDGRTRSRRYEPVEGGRHGGRISLDAGDGSTWTAERYATPRAFVLRRPDGSLAEDHELTDLLGHADATLFSNVFAFGLSELDGFELLDSDSVRDRVFSAGVVGAGRSAREALDTLEARRAALVRPRGRCEVRDLADEVREAARRLAQAQAAATDLVRRRDEVERLADLAADRHREVDAAREEQHRLRALLEAWPARNRLVDIDAELDGIDDHDGIDEDTSAAVERVRAELAAATAGLDEAEADLALAIERREAVVVDPAVADVGAAIRAMAPELAVEEARTARLAELDREVAVQRERLAEQLTRLGPDWDRERLAAFDASIPAADEVRRRGNQIEAYEADLQRLVTEQAFLVRARDESRTELAELEEHLGDHDPSVARDDLDRRSRSLRQLRANLVDLGTASARFDAADRSVAGLYAVLPTTRRPTGSSTVGFGLLMVGVVLGVVALAALVGGAEELAVVLGSVGLGACVLGAAVLLTRRSITRPDDTSHLTTEIREAERTREEARSRLEVLRTSLRAAAMVLDLPPEPTAIDVEDCTASIDELRDEVRRVDEMVRRVEDLRETVEQAEARLSTLDLDVVTLTMTVSRERDEWETWKAKRFLGPDLGVEAINDVFTAIERSRTIDRTLGGLERELESLDEASTAFRTRAAALLRQSGGADDGPDLLVDFRVLVERADADGEARRELDRRVAAVDEAEVRSEAVCDRLALAQVEVARLLTATGASDVDGARQAVVAWRRRRTLEQERSQVDERIRSVIGRGDAAAATLRELDRGDLTGWQAALDDVTARLPEREAAYEEAIRAHHEADRNIEELSRSADVAEAGLAAASARARLAAAVDEWQTLNAARHLIAGTLARYERERQPAVLGRAEAMFAAVTEGHHRALSVVDGQMAIVDRRGRRISTDDLSRGTAEQLYLCLRFGLAAEMATHTPLPFVMDDVLVNFDPERTVRMAAVIAELSQRHQVLLFTCQPTTVEALVAAAPDARVIELPRHGGRGG